MSWLEDSGNILSHWLFPCEQRTLSSVYPTRQAVGYFGDEFRDWTVVVIWLLDLTGRAVINWHCWCWALSGRCCRLCWLNKKVGRRQRVRRWRSRYYRSWRQFCWKQVDSLTTRTRSVFYVFD